ncbi:MAG: carbon-nitrogen hydrolase family protein [Gemmatimonadota bacterium]|nr:carbon-nitrogen hydrolase family protein [Gemmatimonadota bacterium]
MDSLRVAALQYYIRPVEAFDDFAAQVTALVTAAVDYRARLIVFPEYFTTQLLTLGDLDAPIDRQVRRLPDYVDAYVDLFGELAHRHEVHIVAGTILDRGDADDVIHNDAYVFGPDGGHAIQGKLHMTRFEKEEWIVTPRNRMRVFDTAIGRFAVAICYDVEFPEIVRAAAREGANLLVVPSCTDDRRGFLRVRLCAHARAIENRLYVIHAGTVGSLPMVPAVHLNYGQAAILTPSDYAFARDGILAEGHPNEESMVIGDLDMEAIERNRAFGSVLPLEDSERTREILSRPVEVVEL